MSRSVRYPDYRRDPYTDAGRALYLVEHPGTNPSAWLLTDQETRDWWTNRATPIVNAVVRRQP